MDEHPDGPAAPARHLRALPAAGPVGPCDLSPYETPSYDARRAPLLREAGTDAPRVAGLDALLREVDDLRSAVRRDLSLAATAVEADEPGLAAFLLGTADDSVQAFRSSSTDHLGHLADHDGTDDGSDLAAAVGGSDPVHRGRARRMLPAAPLVAAAAALFVGLSGVAPSLTGDLGSSSNASASRSYDELERLADGGASPEAVSQAAEDLHADLAPLLAAASTDPEAALEAIALLTKETGLLRRSADRAHPELQQVLAEAQALVTLLRRATQRPKAPSAPVVVLPPVEAPRSEPSPKASSAPSQKSSPKPAPSSAKPTPSATPSSAPSSTPPSQQASPEPSSTEEPNPLVPGLG